MKRNLFSSHIIIASVSILAMILTACTKATQPVAETVKATEVIPTATVVSNTPDLIVTSAGQSQVTVTPAGYDPKVANSWKLLPVIPEGVSDKMKAVYAAGQNGGGLDAKAFSKIGDCETSSDYFLKPFDNSTSGYSLGEYSELQGVIDHFSGSFEWKSLAAQPGFSISSVFSSLWADSEVCKPNEWPIDCEIRLHKPAFALVMFGTNDVNNTRPTFKRNLEALVDKLLKNDIVPILVTKADNLEKDYSINAIIAEVAYEKEVPLLNYWRAIQTLPNHGLEADNTHLTYAAPHFDDPEAMKAGWPWRNLTALQALDVVWRGVSGE